MSTQVNDNLEKKIEEEVVVKEPERIKLEKKDLVKSFILWNCSCETALSYERLQSLGFCTSMIPILKRLYPDKDDLSEGLTRHLEFFNTENNWGSIIPGMVASMEEEKANGGFVTGDAIKSIKVGLMGPMAGIGDTVTQGLVQTVLIGIALDLATKGNLLAPILFFFTFVAYLLTVEIVTFTQGYRLGKSALKKITNASLMENITEALSILGLTIAGAMVAIHVNITTPLKINVGESTIVFQELLDQLMPGLLGLGATLLVFYFLKKDVKVTKMMVILIVVALLLSFIGVL